MTKDRFYELDLLRFFAAFAVMIYHYCFRGFSADNMSSLSFEELAPVAMYGFLGVQLFFMISGFVILFSAQNSTAKKFTVSRIARLYPAFWACVTITALTTLWIGFERYEVGLFQYLANLSMVSSVFGIEDIDGVYWTLLVEIKFYVMIFLLLALGLMRHIAGFLYVWLIASALSQVLTLPYSVEFFLIPYHAPYFIAGAAFFLVRKRGFEPSTLVLIFSSYALALFMIQDHLAALEKHYSALYSWPTTATIITVFFILFSLMAKKKLAFINRPEMLTLGVLTYPLYLLHQNIGYMLFNLSEGYVSKWLVLVSVIALMLWLSLLVHKHVERVFGPRLKSLLTTPAKRQQ